MCSSSKLKHVKSIKVSIDNNVELNICEIEGFTGKSYLFDEKHEKFIVYLNC